MSGDRQRGRPRDRSRDEAILSTTVDLVNEFGVEGLRIQDVAKRASVGPGTIYRRWETKEHLLVAALQWVMEQRSLPRPRGNDFRARALELVATLDADEASLVPGIVAAMHGDEPLAETFRANWLTPQIDGLREALATLGGSDLPEPVADLLAELIPAYASLRFLLTKEPFDKQFVDRLTEDLVIPLIKAHTK